MQIEVIVGSTSQHKLDAVKEAFWITLPANVDVLIHGEKTSSGQHEQPVGFEEIYSGARNRALSTRDKLTGKGMAIGIESGIIHAESEVLTIDLAVIVIITNDGQEIVTTSPGIQFPEECVMVAAMKGFATTTVGSIIAEEFGGDSTDPHSALTDGAISRRQTLVAGLITGLAQIKF